MIATAIPVTRTTTPRLPEYDFSNIVFGANPTDHMFVARYANGAWSDPRVVPYSSLQLSPVSLCLHYGQTVFEGMKAYRLADGHINLFRPDKHHKRMNKSLDRMCMPQIPEELFMDSLHTLLDADQDWVPSAAGSSLYIRPFVIATEARLGVKVADEYLFLITCMPMGRYYSNAIKVKVETDYARAAHGGTGAAKCGGNYGAAFYPTLKAREEGFDQVLWTDSRSNSLIEESGMMNILFVIDGTLITPALNGNLLDGVTRDSLLQIARAAGVTVEEREISYAELETAFISGRSVEAFGAGTAAAIAPIELISINGISYHTDTSAAALYHYLGRELTAIRSGQQADPFGWNYIIHTQH